MPIFIYLMLVIIIAFGAATRSLNPAGQSYQGRHGGPSVHGESDLTAYIIITYTHHFSMILFPLSLLLMSCRYIYLM